MSKTCTKCNITKDADCFTKRKKAKDGLHPMCKVCKNAFQRKSYADNPHAILASNKKYRDNNKETINEKRRVKYNTDSDYRSTVNKNNTKNYIKNRSDRLAKMREYRIKNKSKILSDVNMRKKKVKRATPPWLSPLQKQQIVDIYSHARDCFVCTGETYDVDHIIPIAGKTVCGLHVPWNLQVLPSDMNRKKWNKHNAA